MDHIKKHFPSFTPEQYDKIEKLRPIYTNWNKKINVISRKDIDAIYEHHVLHSLSIQKIIQFKPGAQIADIGTGGGFPGIPLAIVNPLAHFFLVDTIEKKLKVVNEVVKALDLNNVTTIRSRGEHLNGSFDFVTGRAVSSFPSFVNACKKNIHRTSKHSMKNGIFYLKGGTIEDDQKKYKSLQVIPLKKFFPSSYYEEKYVLYLPVK